MNPIYAVIILLVILCILLWRMASAPRIIPANSTEWVILEWHDLIAGDPQGRYKPESPLFLRFVPIIGWNCKNDGHRKYIYATPITPPVYQRAIEMLNDGFPKDGDKTATFGYCIREGVIFDIDGMRDSDLWERLYDDAFAGHDIQIYGHIPDCYQQKFSEIMKILDRNRTKEDNLQQEGT